MGRVFAFALTAALNPTLLAATTLMLSLERPKRLLFGYLCGALLTSITCGLVLVFALPHTNVPSTARHTVSPAVDLVLGTLLLLVVFVVATGRDRRRREWSDRRREKAKTKAPPKWRRTLSKGSARDTFVIGILLSFPGASYIAGMSALHHEQLSTGATVLTVIAFNAIQMIVLELPLLGYLFAPEKTAERVDRFGTWLHQSGGRVLLWVCGFLGAALILRGLLSL